MGLIPLLTSERGRSLHLPAHGRGAALPSDLREMLRHRAGIWDLPELPELGGPLMQRGEVAESQRQAAVAIGAERGWYG
ncbi:MAG TPA: lysine decarboxylase, partial [Prochlorococcaceae cyanobacterium Fu_MAG_134]|nr:lysine decarboxylase [Prochlorococcaceae cyanobacterium Fu_MAG_134]